MIGAAVEKGHSIQLYDEKGKPIATVQRHDGLLGFTATSVSVKRGAFIYIYNEKGAVISTLPAH